MNLKFDEADEPELHGAFLALALALDPDQQGECWPDPIGWDGRPLADQARDLLALADAAATDGRDELMGLADALRAAARP